MTRHLIRLIWNRKRQNVLLTIEILCSFLVLFGIVIFALHFALNAQQPLGFAIDRVWAIEMGRHAPEGSDDPRVAERAVATRLMTALREMPQVEIAAGAFTAPYAGATWESSLDLADGRKVQVRVNRVTDDFPRVFSMTMAAGRAFAREDDAAADAPVLIDRQLARQVFGDRDPIGQLLPEKRAGRHAPGPDEQPQQPRRVVGVFTEFRQHGEYSTPMATMFERVRLDDPSPAVGAPERLLIRVRPGTTAAFEPELVRRLQREAPDWSFEVKTLESMRESFLKQYTTPLTVLAVVEGFLLLMVALGLTGVVWQSITQRLREFGLRRAAGAPIRSVRGQVLAEMAVMTTFALIVGVALIAQLPFLPLPQGVEIVPGEFVGAVALSAAAIYCLTLACGWYPSRLAARMPPADALRYE
jgi:putative ABC transport system permease protein